MLELTNHVSGTGTYYSNASTIRPGVPFDLRVVFGRTSVDWYIDDAKIWSDGKGVPGNWVGYPIVNLSVCAGKYHPAPTGTSMAYKVTSFRVYR